MRRLQLEQNGKIKKLTQQLGKTKKVSFASEGQIVYQALDKPPATRVVEETKRKVGR
jgi:hypothetical protein